MSHVAPASVSRRCAACQRFHLVLPGVPQEWVCDGCREAPNASCGCSPVLPEGGSDE